MTSETQTMTGPRWRTATLVAACLMLMLQATIVTTPEADASSRRGCDGQYSNNWDPAYFETLASTTTQGRTIELRRSTTAGGGKCTWGRITNGQPGDYIWIDRSYNAGKSWNGQLYKTRIQRGWTQAYTATVEYGGAWVRACGSPGENTPVTCTRWRYHG